jgi:hypothetical protein
MNSNPTMTVDKEYTTKLDLVKEYNEKMAESLYNITSNSSGSNPTTLSVDETIKLPFEAKATGTFNGDMFYDWYNDKPTNEKELHFWRFLHNWEDSISREADDKAIDKIKEYLWQIKT